MAKVSVIVPSFNYGHLLPATLESVARQSIADWECVVVDDGSTDDTAAVVQDYAAADSRFRYIHQQNRGLSAARNTGIREAAGDFLQFLDADDLIVSKKLETQLLVFRQQPATDIVFGGMRYFRTEDPGDLYPRANLKYQPPSDHYSVTGLDLLRHLLVENIVVVSSPLIRKEVVAQVGNFDESLKALEDWDFWIRCAMKNLTFSYFASADAYTYIRVHGSSMSSNALKMLTTNLAIRKRIQPLLEGEGLRRFNEKGIVDVENAMAFLKLKDGNLLEGGLCLVGNLSKLLKYKFFPGK